jgi:hypothetical protein
LHSDGYDDLGTNTTSKYNHVYPMLIPIFLMLKAPHIAIKRNNNNQKKQIHQGKPRCADKTQ